MADMNTPEYVNPDEDIIMYFRNRLEIKGKMDAFRKNDRGKRRGDKKPLPSDIDSQSKKIASKKVEILDDYIFPAMANLTFFFEAIAEYPQLQATFEQDLKDLLGIRRYNPRTETYGYMLRRLIGAILIIGNEEYDNDVYDNKHDKDKEFRFRLLNILQILVWQKFWPYLQKMFPDNKAQGAIASDFFRVDGWTSILGFPVNDDYKPPGRTFKVKSAKEIIEGKV